MNPRTRHRRALSAVALLAFLAACKTPSKDVATFTPREQVMSEMVTGVSTTLGVGDVLDIRVYQEPDLSGAFRVGPEGTIDYPFCGRLNVTGVTSSKLVDMLTGCLKNGYLKKPQVTVFVKEYNSKKVFVFGEVQKPGTFLFEERMSVVQVITLAGGFSKLAAKNSVIVTRLVDGQERKIKVPVENIGQGREKNFALEPGDIVYVPESFL